MGKSRVVPVTVEMTVASATGTYACTPAEWRSRARGQFPGYGLPTEENLAAYVKKFEESTKEGGCNAHLGLSVVFSAKVTDHRTGSVVATYRGPSFVVI